MSLRQMEYLLVVVEEGSFTRAAQRLSISQPALSHQIRALEQSVGEPLLERLPGSVLLTPMGREYLPHAAAAVRSAQHARHVVRPVGETERIGLRIVASYSVALGIVPPAVLTWRRSYPQAQVEVLEFGCTEDMARQMACGVADVAVGPPPRHWDGPVHDLGSEELVLVLPADDPLLARGRRTLPLRELADRDWVLYTDDNALAPVVAQACAVAGFAPRAAVRTRHTATAVQLAAAGLGPALAPKSIIESDFHGALLDPRPSIRRELVAYTAARAAPHVSAFIEVLAERGAVRSRRGTTPEQ
jgi:DNA-binding transcriptional LysR family regulator